MPTLTNTKRFLPQAKEAFQTALTSDIASGATTVPIDSTTGYTNGDTVVLVIDPSTSSKQVFTGVINTASSRVDSVVWTEGTNIGHTSGAVVVDYVTATHLGLVTKGLKPANTGIYRVNEYGAVGDGTTDDTTAIQAAIDAASTAGGGTVAFSKATYLVTTLNLKSYVSLKGVGGAWNTAKGTVIKTTATTGRVLYYTSAGAGLTNCNIEDIRVEGPSSGTGKGIELANGGGSTNPHIAITMRNLKVVGFTGAAGIECACIIVSTFENITVETCATGFYMNGGAAFANPNTSLTFSACYANGCTTTGFNLRSSVYSVLNGCAADDCGTAYLVDTCNQITLNSCGSEWANPTTASPADGFKITGSNRIVLNAPYTYQNKHYSFWITGASKQVILIAPSENTPVAATNSYKTDAATQVTVIAMDFTTARSEAGHTNFLDDGAGGITTADNGYVYSNGTVTAAGNLIMYGGELLHMTYPTTTWAVATNENIMLCDATAAGFTATLPTAVGREGQTYTFKKIDSSANVVTIATTSAQTIDGVTTQALSTQYESITVVSNNANWFIL